jgi:hypothetical protein
VPIDLEVLHDGVRYVEHGLEPNPKALKERRRRLVAELKRLGYQVDLKPLALGPIPDATG